MIDFKRLDHVLITIPPGSKKAAREFYMGVLYLKEITGDHARGAIWFEIGNIQLHIREENGHKTNSDRHPAFVVDDSLSAKEFLKRQGIEISYSSEIEGRERCFFRDPFGNRFELIEYKK
ncbi:MULTISPECIES: VOC family protein [Sphingobacterium]|uniref:VOC family protein n=1 Tax=Sphingobacterium TaxID=28453 RepID=UPI00257F652C|nr:MULTISPECIES: VOC family protein [Sphingobacterium]